jgi:NAD(P)-dependent dehydrogenase (short-subunit alcohol dehydrogenase family)
MGEETSGMNSSLNGTTPHDTHSDSNDPSEIRSDIEETRAEMSETIDAIQSKLDPQRVKERVADTVREATVGRAQYYAEQARAKIEEVATPAMAAIKDAAHRVEEKRHAHDGMATTGQERDAKQLKPISEQVVVVFGASSGIGRETATQFAKRGAKVVVAARSEAGLLSLVESIRNLGGHATPVAADVTDFAQVKAVADRAVAEYGRLDTWVHCAAVSLYATFEETTPEEFARLIEVNLVGQAYGAMAALPHLRREGRGALIHISSVEAKRAFPLQSAYSSSKHGIIGFLDALRMELMRDGVPISVTNVMPAGINTPFFNKARTKMGLKPMPAPPIYHPQVVAEVILHAAEHPTRDITAGGASKMMIAMQKMSPALLDAIYSRAGFSAQQTKEHKSPDAPDNLFGAIEGYDKVGGDFSDKSKPKSISNWLETHPQAQRAIQSVAVAGVALWLLRRRS